MTHEALAGCTFQLRYLAGTSGTGGTVIGQKVTGANGIAMWTGLEPGAYVIEEVDPADGYSIINSSETVYLADNGEQSVVTVRFDNMPDGNLLVRKVCATNPSVTLQNAEFKIMYADGRLIGDSNGIYRTDENGEIRIEGLEPGKSVIVTEVRAPAGFILDTQSQTIQIKEGRTVSLTFKNQPRGKLIIQKRDSQTNEVLPGAEFRITTAAGCEVGLDGVIGTSSLTQNGIFTTDSQGEIRISNLAPGAYVINEIKAPDGYVIDTPSTNVVIGTGGDTQTVIVKDTKKGGLIIEKYDSITKQPLRGARFKVMTANGELTPDNEGLTSSNGLYTTDINGQIVLSKLLPGTYVVSEDMAPDNYRKDPTPQTVVVAAGDTQTLRFYDDPLCTLTILKRDAVTKKPLKGAEFLVTDSSGHVIGLNNGLYTTGTDGTVTVTGLAPNSTIVVSERRAPTGYVLDETPKNIVVRSGVANSLIFDNEPGTTLIIRKFIEGTENEPLSGVAFRVVDGAGAAVGPDDGLYYTDKSGEIVLEGIEPGTILDTQPKTFYVQYGGCTTITWPNTAVRGQIQIVKKSADYNSVNSLPAGTPLAGATFEIYNERNGNKVDTIVTDKNGLASSKALPLGRYTIKETKAPANYGATNDTYTAVLEHSGQIVKLEITNKSVSTGVSIEKTGPKEAMRGQPVRYVFSGIGNTSNVTLQSFYWRDTLPAEVKLDKIVTGTYNFPGNYKIVYKVNNTGDYRTLADNLSTSKNYTLAASPVALGLASNQRVTEIMFVFGQAPGGFSQVEQPMIYCTALSNLAPGSSFVNVADVGGTYNGVWLQAVTRWVTNVYGKPVVPTLPKTGY